MTMSAAVMLMMGFCLLVLVWMLMEWVWLRPKKLEKYLRQHGFSGSSYRFLVGDTVDSKRMDQIAHSKPSDLEADVLPRIMPFISHTVQKYGKKCFTWYGPYPNLIITDPETLREIFSRHEMFPKPKLFSHVHAFVSGLLNLEGKKWSKHRSFLNPSFRIDSLKSIFPGFHMSCKEMLTKWETLASANGFLEIDCWPYCLSLSENMLARAVFGDCYKDGIKIFELLQEQIDLGVKLLKSVYIPGSRFLPTKSNKRLKETERDMKIIFRGMIETKEKELSRGGDLDNGNLLSSMLASNAKLIREQGPDFGLSIDDIIDDCEEFYQAGNSATSSLFVWTLVMLSKHQNWQDKARYEVVEVFGQNTPNFDGLTRLKTITMVLHEVLRLYSPAYFTCRTTKEEIKLEKFSLPAGVMITIPMLMVHRDQDLWGRDANEFRPETFANGVSGATNGRLSFLPFGSGPRTCLGLNFSMVQAKLLVAMVLQRFSLALSSAYTHAPFPAITTLPQHGAHLLIHKL